MARVTIEADPHDYRGLILAMNRMEKGAQNKLRDDVAAISRWTAAGIAGNYTQDPYPNQAAIVAQSVRAKRDRMPFVEIGGRSARTYSGTPAGILLMGNEFGAIKGFKGGGRRFPFPAGRKAKGFLGYWIYPALRMMQPEVTKRWKAAVWLNIERQWSRG